VFFGFCRGWEMEFGLVDCWRGVDWSGGNDGLKDGRPLGFARGKKPGGASVKGADGPTLRVLLRTVCFSRLEWWAALCFVWVACVSNRSGSRLEILGSRWVAWISSSARTRRSDSRLGIFRSGVWKSNRLARSAPLLRRI
jgi:hypothetical protein